MPGESLTNKPVTEELKDSSYVLVSQDEDIEGEVKQALRRIPISVLSKYLGVDELKKVAALIPLGNGDGYVPGFKRTELKAIINTEGELIDVDPEYAYCVCYEGHEEPVCKYVGETLYVSGACCQTAPLCVFKDCDGNVIGKEWANGATELTVAEEYAVVVPAGAETIYVNQLRGQDFVPAVVGYFKKVVIGNENLSEAVKNQLEMASTAEQVENKGVPNGYAPLNGDAVVPDEHLPIIRERTLLSNALKGNSRGTVVALNDVSPVEHIVDCTVRSRNMLPYPYANTTKTINGVTFTDNGDGSITINGTATASANFTIISVTNPLYIPKGEAFTIKNIVDKACGVSICVFGYINGVNSFAESVTAQSRTLTPKGDYDYYTVIMYVSSGSVIDNITVYPQIEIGTEATEWAPYVVPDTVTISRCGKNLSPVSQLTPSGTAAWQIVSSSIIYLPVGKYTVSANYSNTGESTIIGIEVTDINNTALGSNTSTYTNASGICTYPFEVSDISLGVKICCYANYTSSAGGSYSATYSNIQIEAGDTKTDYAEYITPITYTPASDGTVEGLISIAPDMTLIPNADNVIIDVEYNRDINKAFAELQQAIISLGGNI